MNFTKVMNFTRSTIETTDQAIDEAIQVIQTNQNVTGIKDELARSKDLDTFTDNVMKAVLSKKDINMEETGEDTNDQIEFLAAVMDTTTFELIVAVKELTETPVCKRTTNNLNDKIKAFFGKYGITVEISIIRKALTRCR